MDAFEHKGNYVLVLNRAEYETMVNDKAATISKEFEARVMANRIFTLAKPAYFSMGLYKTLLKIDPILKERFLCED